MLGFDTTRPINCQVCAKSDVCHLTPALTRYDLKLWAIFELVSTATDVLCSPRGTLTMILIFQDLCMLGL